MQEDVMQKGMKTNHRRINKPDHNNKTGCTTVKASVKAESRKGRRANERILMQVLRSGCLDLEDFCAWTKNQHVSNVWDYD